ncbi:hypothetical protein DY000_02030278 [Brassica cretica]|uniref:Uncharacterized protein n=1 Tax=Brassica cretica TaxID=69181 RepID=A0ABQ7DP18_BRACR|nr:hypothetical protein DY000_02030278 [Brassica cretica]
MNQFGRRCRQYQSKPSCLALSVGETAAKWTQKQRSSDHRCASNRRGGNQYAEGRTDQVDIETSMEDFDLWNRQLYRLGSPSRIPLLHKAVV